MKRAARSGRTWAWLAASVLCSSLLCANLLGAQAISGAGAGCVELVKNNSFEAATSDWAESSAQGYPLISDFNPRTGELSAYLAGVNGADDRISQRITLPVEATGITLRAWWYLATAETAGAFDTLTIWLLRPDQAPLAQLARMDNSYPAGVWEEAVIDLSAYAGQEVIVQFAGLTDENNISDFYVDDVSISACSAEGTPTATATPTVTPTPSATHTPDPNRTYIFLPLIQRG